MTDKILCYNHECRGKFHWCCKDGKECKPEGCKFYEDYRKHCKRVSE